MKKLILSLILAMPVAASANEEAAICDDIYGLAESIMIARQNGTTLKDAKNVVNKNRGNEWADKTALSLVDWAYSYPKHKDEYSKNVEIANFASQAYYMCGVAVSNSGVNK
jgi:3-hydroxyisobutyrate dehydrogenase-like beta-hydroxyacid dehydrogenase